MKKARLHREALYHTWSNLGDIWFNLLFELVSFSIPGDFIILSLLLFRTLHFAMNKRPCTDLYPAGGDEGICHSCFSNQHIQMCFCDLQISNYMKGLNTYFYFCHILLEFIDPNKGNWGVIRKWPKILYSYWISCEITALIYRHN